LTRSPFDPAPIGGQPNIFQVFARQIGSDDGGEDRRFEEISSQADRDDDVRIDEFDVDVAVGPASEVRQPSRGLELVLVVGELVEETANEQDQTESACRRSREDRILAHTYHQESDKRCDPPGDAQVSKQMPEERPAPRFERLQVGAQLLFVESGEIGRVGHAVSVRTTLGT
jgi:hypothetical protein